MKNAEKKRLMNSLNRIEGHAKGIRNMVHSDRCIADVLLQLSAVRAGIVKAQTQVLYDYLDNKERSPDELRYLCRSVLGPSSRREK